MTFVEDYDDIKGRVEESLVHSGIALHEHLGADGLVVELQGVKTKVKGAQVGFGDGEGYWNSLTNRGASCCCRHIWRW